MQAAKELGLFLSMPGRKPVSFQKSSSTYPESSDLVDSLGDLDLFIQEKIENLSAQEKLNKDKVLECEELRSKISTLSGLHESLVSIQKKLQRAECRQIFTSNRYVCALNDRTFKVSVTNLRKELDDAIIRAPILLNQREDFSERVNRISKTIKEYQIYAGEFQKTKFFNNEHNLSVFVELGTMLDEMVEDIKTAVTQYPNEVPFFESFLEKLLNDPKHSRQIKQSSFMKYESHKVGWLFPSASYHDIAFDEVALHIRVDALKKSLQTDYVRAGLGLLRQINRFSESRQRIITEIEAQLKTLSAFPEMSYAEESSRHMKNI